MNVIYFRLKPGQEDIPLRGLALKDFPNTDLDKSVLCADGPNENEVFDLIVKQIKAGEYDRLYIENSEVISKDVIKASGFINQMLKLRPDFEIEFKGGVKINSKTLDDEVMKKLVNIIKNSLDNA